MLTRRGVGPATNTLRCRLQRPGEWPGISQSQGREVAKLKRSKRAGRRQVRALAVMLAEMELMLMRDMKATVDDNNARLRELAFMQDELRAELHAIAARLDSREPAVARPPVSLLGIHAGTTGPVPPDLSVFQRSAHRASAGAPEAARASGDADPQGGLE